MRGFGHSVRKSTQDSGNDGRRRAYSRSINDIRRSEYPQLDGTTYLDHAGATPYSKSLMEEYVNDMKSNLFGNPHSQSPSSMLSTRRIESVRTQTLEFFKADPEFFDLIFVANATAAIKLVMEGMQGHDRGHGNGRFWYGYHCDSHTSLTGLRELASAGSKCFRSDQEVENWLSDDPEASSFRPHQTEKDPCIGLFAYPAQSNMNGRRLPLSWPCRLRSSNRPSHSNVYSLLDAAAFVSTAQLYLGDWKAAPDFTALSFYKIFGYPDLGALIVRKEAGHVLQKRLYFGGGTVHMVINAVDSPTEAWYARKTETLHEALEDGTPAFHSIIALGSALKVHRKVYGSMDNVSHHTCSLAKVLYQELSSLTHGNGVALCKIYKDSTSEYGDSQTQGPTIAFNVRDSSGSWIGKSLFEQLALVNNIQLRIGGVCNPGGIARFLDWAPSSLRDNFAQGLRCANGLDEIDGKPTE